MKNRINCGITALESLTKLNKISVKTLNSFAKDNGLDLKSYQLSKDKIKNLRFPFIVYTTNHFSVINNSKDLKELELTGIVLTEQVLEELEIEGENIIGENITVAVFGFKVEIPDETKDIPNSIGVVNPPGGSTQSQIRKPISHLFPTQPDSWGGGPGDSYPVFPEFDSFLRDYSGRTIKIFYQEPILQGLPNVGSIVEVLTRANKGTKLSIAELDNTQKALGYGLMKIVHETNLLKIQNDNLFDYINILNDYVFPAGMTTSVLATYSLTLTLGATISSPTYSNNIHLGSVLSIYDNSFDPLQNEIKINYDGASYSIPVGLTLSGSNLSLLDVSGQTVSQITLNSSGSNVDLNQISFGGPTGLTSSTRLQFNTTNNNLILGFSHSITGTSSQSSIIGGFSGNIANTCYSSILGGFCGSIATASNFSSIIGGYCNNVFSNSSRSSIIGGVQQSIEISDNSIIGGGNGNSMISSDFASIIGGNVNTISNSTTSTILGSCTSIIDCSRQSGIVGGQYGRIYDYSYQSFIGGGYCNSMDCNSRRSIIGGGFCNSLYKNVNESSIIGGKKNHIEYSNQSSIIGGYLNLLYSPCCSAIIGGYCNKICSYSRSSIVGGYCNTLSVNDSSIIGGLCNIITGDSCRSSIIGGYKNTIEVQSCSNQLLAGDCNKIYCQTQNASIIGGYKNTICQSSFSSIIGGNNLLLNNKPNTVLVPTLLVSGSFSTDCGNTFGINGSFTAGANTITVCNGVIVSIV